MKPIAFLIRDFRSIVDTNRCSLAGDNVTILAGQNEAGKSAILMALRDFDLPEDSEPETEEYLPEGHPNPIPMVWVHFEVDADKLNGRLAKDGLTLPPVIYEHLKKENKLWIGRRLSTKFFWHGHSQKTPLCSKRVAKPSDGFGSQLRTRSTNQKGFRDSQTATAINSVVAFKRALLPPSLAVG